MLVTGGIATAGGAIAIGGAAGRLPVGAFGGLSAALQSWYRERVLLQLRDERGDPIQILRKHLYTSRLVPENAGPGWSLQVDHLPGWNKRSDKLRTWFFGRPKELKGQRETMIVHGPEAIGLAGQLMAHANRRGGAAWAVRKAVARIEDAGHPEAFLPKAAEAALRDLRQSKKREWSPKKIEKMGKPLPGSLAGLKVDMRLAIEMATHEQAEREALEGELKELEARWREAEEIARIADNLFVPESVDSFIEGERTRLDAGPVNPTKNVRKNV